MSTTLYWTPPPTEPKEYVISSLKRALAAKLGQYDGSVSETLGMVGPELIPFLEGLSYGSDHMAKDAKELISAIEKYGQVQLIIY